MDIMTKGQLIRTLEPFEDSTDIVLLGESNYEFVPDIYFCLVTDGPRIILSIKEPKGKFVKLSIRG